MIAWIIAGLAAAVAGSVVFRKELEAKSGLALPSSKQLKTGDSAIVRITAVNPTVPSDTLRAELAIIKAASAAKGSVRVDDVIIENAKSARGTIIGTPSTPTTTVRFDTAEVIGIERPDTSEEGFKKIL